MASKKVQVPLTVQEAEDLVEKLKALENHIAYPSQKFVDYSSATDTVRFLLKKVKSALKKAEMS